MSKRLWQDAKIRAEFNNDFSTLEAFLRNEHRSGTHTSKIKRFERPPADTSDDLKLDPHKIKWDSDASLRAEFDDNFENYKSWKKNQHRVRNFA
jgi:hypothetical protein